MQQTEMNVVSHLAELRSRLIRTLVAFLVAFCASFLYVKDLYRWLVRGLEDKLAILGPTDIIWVYLLIAGVFAIAATIPVAAYQTWRFVKPALTREEQRSTLAYVPVLTLLFLIGLCFGYFILFPMVLEFLERMSGEFLVMYTAEKYFRFMVNMTVPFAFLFEMPAVVMFLTKLGIINPVRLQKARKLAYFILTIIAVTITPPDIVSDILVIVPLFLLYEISVSLSKFVYRKKLAQQEAA
ncbi:twin-arginine translocase subunit TatC [Xylanibacillus composti]|uniref:Sec-independent protein translocase protein TatC n=1 Tax=Xylanibacillus composti TaxID=1572762 RepID=A0A8J4M258_9BACL|nr:twin-arginine translocase subunit TatC [Xylanibacillus composti]MDT9724942.1 twin-arginine translocase subunit TatC [Xylanibacillus composti]GIQ68181.1 Sec-independent protein translocase protein TatCd [Xylanibacillus composti]